MVVSIPFATAGHTVMVSLPQGMGFGHLYMGAMEEAIPRSMAVSPTFTLRLGVPSPSHWAILTDADFIAHLESKKAKWQDREAKAKETAAQEEKEAHTKEGGKSKGKKGTKNKSGSSRSGKTSSSKADASGLTTRKKTNSMAQEAGASSQGGHPESSVGQCLK